MQITDYKGKLLIEASTLEEIEKQADLIVKNKDVGLAYESAEHLRRELLQIPNEEIKPFLEKYRRISSKLKSLALPLLPQEEVGNLLENNLDFLDTESAKYLKQGIVAYFACLPEDSRSSVKEDFLSRVPEDGVFSREIFEILSQEDDIEEDFGKAEKMANQIEPIKFKDERAESLARQIFSQSGFGGAEEDFVRRAKALIYSRLRDVRTKTDLYDYLSRPFQVGGLGLSGEALDFAEKVIDEEYNEVNGIKLSVSKPANAEKKIGFTESENAEKIMGRDQEKEDVAEDYQSRVSDTEKEADYKKRRSEPLPKSFFINQQDMVESVNLNDNKVEEKSKLTQGEKIQLSEKNSAQEEIDKLIKADSSDLAPLESILKGIPPSKPAQNSYFQKDSKAVVMKDEAVSFQDENAGSVVMPRRAQAPNGKVRLDDIKFHVPDGHKNNMSTPIKSFGLSDELSTITFTDYRSMGGVSVARDKILSKIKVLEQDSLESKIAGIASFRKSPLYRQYLSIGEESLSKGKKLAEALSDAQINPERMTEDEFFDISDLNNKLK